MAERWGKFITLDHDGTKLGYLKTVAFGVLSFAVFLAYQYIGFVHLFWLLTLTPLWYVAPELYLRIEGFFHRWLLYLLTSQQYHQHYMVTEVGTDIKDLVDDGGILISNHQSTADVFTLMYLLSHHGVSQNSMWIQDMILKYTHFGPLSLLHGDFYLEQKDLKSTQMDRLTHHLKEVFIPNKRKWALLFPEGGFLRKRRQRSQEYAKKHGFPVLNNVVLPRVGALGTLLNTLPTEASHQNGSNGVANDHHKSANSEVRPLKWLVDTTVGYPNNLDLNGITILCGTRNACNVTVHHRKFPISELPKDTESLTQWMYDRFVEKEELLEVFHKTGKFPEWNEVTRSINADRLLTDARPLRHNEYIVLALKIFYLLLLNLMVFILFGPAVQASIFSLTTVCVLYLVCSVVLYQMGFWFR